MEPELQRRGEDERLRRLLRQVNTLENGQGQCEVIPVPPDDVVMDATDTLDLSELKYLVLDGADEMLTMGLGEDFETILADTPTASRSRSSSRPCPRRSGESPPDTSATPRRSRSRPARRPPRTPSSFTSSCSAPGRSTPSCGSLRWKTSRRQSSSSHKVGEGEGAARRYSAGAISGNGAEAQRERTVTQLRSGNLDVLVAADVSARRLDVDRISRVINHGTPIDTESYVHRIGRGLVEPGTLTPRSPSLPPARGSAP